ncbi:uncharacterized protein [Fopius arisanus]|uniref:Uncharacterized protein isoform X2 n=1 Tax=Fopius arisanus TaxID=64838 RepID=A0A9R1TPT3_9HYME|nr:PREDICTED: uncharacterized protein LOC105272865 isoform X2 [Fopius arisanus]
MSSVDYPSSSRFDPASTSQYQVLLRDGVAIAIWIIRRQLLACCYGTILMRCSGAVKDNFNRWSYVAHGLSGVPSMQVSLFTRERM